MTLLLDQGLPRSTVLHFRHTQIKPGIESVHVGDLGLASASDASILNYAREQQEVVVTLDADFHALLALSGAAKPSAIRIRIEGLRAESLAELLAAVLETCTEDLTHGAMISVTERGIRVRHLPVLR